MHSDYEALLRALSEGGVRFLIVGGYAVMEYTEPRFTKDLDLWVARDAENARATYHSLAAFGAPVAGVTPDDFTEPDVVYQIGVTPVRIDVMTSVAGLEFEEAWQRRVERDIAGVRIAILGIDDLIANKQAVGRPHDRIDARRLRSVAESRKKAADNKPARRRKRPQE